MWSNSTSPPDIIQTNLVNSFPDNYFLDLIKLTLSRKAGCFPQFLKMAVVKTHLKKAKSDNEYFSNHYPLSNLILNSKLLEQAAFIATREHPEKNSLFSK